MPSTSLSAQQPVGGDEASRSSQDSSRPQTIPRKPLPDSARPLTPESPADDSRLQPDTWSPGEEAALPALPSQPSGDSGLALDCEAADVPLRPPPGLQAGMPARKPLAPGAAGLLAPGSEKALPPVPQERRAPEQGDQGTVYFSRQNPARSPSPAKNSRRPSLGGTPFTLTLIRREPSS